MPRIVHADMRILRNTHRRHKVTLRSADGDSIDIPARTQHPVHKKFLWSLPSHVRHMQTNTVPVDQQASAIPQSNSQDAISDQHED